MAEQSIADNDQKANLSHQACAVSSIQSAQMLPQIGCHTKKSTRALKLNKTK